MPLNDLTPQLRTRLGRVERVVGIFVFFATLILLGGFGYYIWHTAEQKGWFLTKVRYFTFVKTAAGLRVGQPVKMMGFDVGKITEIKAQPPDDFTYNVFIQFEIAEPHFGYIWTDSRVKAASADLLGNRFLEITKGGTSGRTNGLHATYREEKVNGRVHPTGVWDDKSGEYIGIGKSHAGYWILVDESPALSDRLEAIVSKAETALPNILALTNQLQLVLSNSAALTSNLNTFALQIQPTATNLALITANLRDPKGSLGEWLIPTNTHARLDETLATANVTLGSANRTIQATETNLDVIVSNLNLTLLNLANITSNLNVQVQENTNLVSGVNRAIGQADTLMQGLKKHWLLRSVFKESKTNSTPTKLLPPDVKSGKRP